MLLSLVTLQDQLLAGAALGFTWLLGVVLYRLVLHPLAHIPGPKLAALTTWYEIYYDVHLKGRYAFKIMELHERYGPVVRIAPNEVHVADPEFLDTLYDSRRRNKLPENSLLIEESVAGTVHYDLHRKRRQAMLSYFNPRAVAELEPLLVRKRDALVEMLRKGLVNSEAAESVNLSDLYFGYTWDVINEYAFASESNVLADPAKAHALRMGFTSLFTTVHFSMHFAWVNALAGLLPSFLSRRLTPPGVADMIALSQRVLGNVNAVLADDSTDTVRKEGAAEHRSIFYTLRDDPALPAPEKAPSRLQSEGTFLVLAGTESPARTLAIAHFHLLANPPLLARLRDELREVPATASARSLEQLPFLNAVLAEANRISFGVTRRSFRLAPDEVLRHAGVAIPPNTPVAVSTLAVHANKEIFPDPWSFKPERWLGAEGNSRRKYNIAFGAKGPRACLGMHLAEAEMRLALARVVALEMELFETTVEDVEFRHDFQVAQGRLDSKGVRVLVKGVAEGFE